MEVTLSKPFTVQRKSDMCYLQFYADPLEGHIVIWGVSQMHATYFYVNSIQYYLMQTWAKDNNIQTIIRNV